MTTRWPRDNAVMRATCRDAWVTLIGAALLLAWDLSGLDLTVVRWFGTQDGFAWRDTWLTSTLLHQGGRALGWIVLSLLAVNAFVRPLLPGPSQGERLRWLGAAFACLLLVPALKKVNSTSCPWDLAEFGGRANYVPHWWFGVADGGAGHCFPSGHAVAAFAFFSVHFLLRSQRPGAARVWLAGVGIVGSLFGWAQVARGAHYPSHALWSAWLCWTLCAMVAATPVLRNATLGALPRHQAR